MIRDVQVFHQNMQEIFKSLKKRPSDLFRPVLVKNIQQFSQMTRKKLASRDLSFSK